MKYLYFFNILSILYFFSSKELYSTNIELLNETSRSTLINQGRYEYAEQQIEQGDIAMLQQNYLSASKHYYNAIESILQDNQIFTELRKQAIHSLCNAIILLASQENITPDLPQPSEADFLIKKILNKVYPPYCNELIQLSNHFYNKQLKFFLPSEKIKDFLLEGEINYKKEAWEDALASYKKVLSLDQHNATALLGIKLICKKKKEYATLAGLNRSDMVRDIDKAWKLPHVETNSDSQNKLFYNEKEDFLSKKLYNLIIPQVDFYYISIVEALKQLKHQAYVADKLEIDPNKKGINIVLKMDTVRNNNPELNVHLSLRNVPLGEIINYLAEQTNLKVTIEPYAVTLSPINEDELNQPLLIQEYKIPPDFFYIFSDNQKSQLNGIKQESNCSISEKEVLISQGIPFPKGSSAHYFSDSNILIVKNTLSNLNLLNSLIKNATEHPPVQVEIEARFVEVKQNLLQEKGLNWLLGSFPIVKNIKSGGGTVGNQTTDHPQDYPIQQNGIPVGSIMDGFPGTGSVTAGNRIGSSAITANTLDTLLGGYFFAPSSGVLALAGVLTNPQFQVVFTRP